MNISRERWEQIDALFDAALDCPPHERDAFLRDQCNGDAELYQSVQELLEASEASDSFLESPIDRYAQALWSALNAEKTDSGEDETSDPNSDEETPDG